MQKFMNVDGSWFWAFSCIPQVLCSFMHEIVTENLGYKKWCTKTDAQNSHNVHETRCGKNPKKIG